MNLLGAQLQEERRTNESASRRRACKHPGPADFNLQGTTEKNPMNTLEDLAVQASQEPLS